MSDKDTIDTNPAPKATSSDTPDSTSQYSGSTDSNSPYSLINLKSVPYSTNTMKNQKKKENKIYDKVTIDPPLPPTHPMLIPPNASAQYYVSNDSYLPYLLINRKFAPYSTNARKTRKIRKIKLMIKLKSTPRLPLMYPELIPPILPPKMLSPLTPIPHIH